MKFNLHVVIFVLFFQRIPKKFNELYGPIISNDVVLILNNGDRWFCTYDYMSRRIVGLENFMEWLHIGLWL